MIVRENLEQGSEEWFRARLGCATASAASKIITSTGKLSASRVGYAREIALECEIASKGFKGNDATEHGNYWEPYARARSAKLELNWSKHYALDTAQIQSSLATFEISLIIRV